MNVLAGCRSVDEFDRFNRIDEGTYGIVTRGRDKRDGRIVALKKVKLERERDGFPLTALREINILLAFHHPNIVNVFEVVTNASGTDVYMVMEFMEHDLKGLLENMGKMRFFTVSQVKCLMHQLLSGVEYLHDMWVLHRDLKTSNILMNNRGELKICDFGLSRQFAAPLKPYTPIVVTLWYRAPELLLGAQYYSTPIDLWSVGCIMGELILKEPLLPGEKEWDEARPPLCPRSPPPHTLTAAHAPHRALPRALRRDQCRRPLIVASQSHVLHTRVAGSTINSLPLPSHPAPFSHSWTEFSSSSAPRTRTFGPGGQSCPTTARRVPLPRARGAGWRMA